MDVICIFPIVTNEHNIPKILTLFKQKIMSQLEILGVTSLNLKFAGMDYNFVGVSKSIEGQPKGKGIKDILKNVATPQDYVLVCDGSGAIPFEEIVGIFTILSSDSSMHCVMAERIGNKAISKVRYLIERFEVFILQKYFHHLNHISDGQCGLWGYYAKEINGSGKIELTAEGYDIELDLLSEVLKKNINYCFHPVELPLREGISSNFDYSQNLTKMEFLLKKHEGMDKDIPCYLKEFIKLSKDKLDELNEPDLKIWENYCENIKSIKI